MRILITLFVAAAAALSQDYGTNYRMKIPVGGEDRKGVLFVPADVRKGEVFPLLVAIPDTKSKAFLELAQWQQRAYDHRFAVFSVDTVTGGKQGWHPKEQLEMQRDMEAVTKGLELAYEQAKSLNVKIDESAVILTGHSGGTFLTLWLGIRRPDLFLGVCGRSCVFFKETVVFGKFDKIPPNKQMPIFLYHGELDHPRCKKDTELAKKTLQEAGFTNVKHQVVPKMTHESKPEVCLEWFTKLIKETAKPRREARKIKEEVDGLRDAVTAGQTAAYSKLAKLVEKERKVGVSGGAATLLAEVEAAAQKHWDMAADLEANHQYLEAAEMFKQLMKKYGPLGAAKKARTHRAKLIKSDGYKAEELLAKAMQYLDKGNKDKAFETLEKLVDKYGETVAAEKAKSLLQG